MNATSFRPRTRRKRSRARAWVLLALAFVLVFSVGVALGQALHDNPKPGGSQTLVRTFRP